MCAGQKKKTSLLLTDRYFGTDAGAHNINTEGNAFHS